MQLTHAADASPVAIAHGRAHLAAISAAANALGTELLRIEDWGRELGARLALGQRLLVAGNGGSAAQAQHLTAELVGRFDDERVPLSALALHTETSTLTAVANDEGYDRAFARQVLAHGRPGDVLLCLSTSGESANLQAAARAAHAQRLTTWAFTGDRPNSLAEICDDALCVRAMRTATIQEAHLVALHLLCAAIDRTIGAS
jgi:D-sedoheptulose 7-phosphate isomerase